MSDEHRRDAMGCVRHKHVKTPNLDALAARGTLFENAYTPSPMCVPTRAAFACGDHVHNVGYWDSAAPYDGQQKSWMHKLRDAKRQTGQAVDVHRQAHVVGGIGWTPGLLRKDPPNFYKALELAKDVGVGRHVQPHTNAE